MMYWYTLFQNALYRVTLNPFIGQPTEAENIRYIIPHPDYTLLYRHIDGAVSERELSGRRYTGGKDDEWKSVRGVLKRMG